MKYTYVTTQGRETIYRLGNGLMQPVRKTHRLINNGYFMTKISLRRAFQILDHGNLDERVKVSRHLVNGYVSHFQFSVDRSYYTDNTIRIGCKHFSPRATSALRKWAFDK